MSLPIPVNSYSQGYALCTPEREILGHTYRPTAHEAVEVLLAHGIPFSWAELQAAGWTVEFAYAHVFKPVFRRSQPASQDPETEVAA
ncbi:hypothetical protein C8J31_102108 [Rhizobium sp. PP-CC-2G-626]|nr:hypothetical protein C8J31_102108 [Rhizobium sp. PP-CC-2G-626]